MHYLDPAIFSRKGAKTVTPWKHSRSPRKGAKGSNVHRSDSGFSSDNPHLLCHTWIWGQWEAGNGKMARRSFLLFFPISIANPL